MENRNTFPHRVAGRLVASDLIEITQYCYNGGHKFHIDGRVDPRKPRSVKLWFADEDVAQYFSEKFALKA